ncbi:hypothetical protein HOY82DRAFT_71578 [Tuber indicum]|nr:hypothetical protein HOY82DRAFT_71578 [Tuber indicum]
MLLSGTMALSILPPPFFSFLPLHFIIRRCCIITFPYHVISPVLATGCVWEFFFFTKYEYLFKCIIDRYFDRLIDGLNDIHTWYKISVPFLDNHTSLFCNDNFSVVYSTRTREDVFARNCYQESAEV